MLNLQLFIAHDKGKRQQSTTVCYSVLRYNCVHYTEFLGIRNGNQQNVAPIHGIHDQVAVAAG